MRYQPIIPNQSSEELSSHDNSPIKNESYKAETNYVNYNSVLNMQVPDINETMNSINIPTEVDYLNGYYMRYFIFKRNESIIFEVTKNMYDSPNSKYDMLLYDKFDIRWKLTGPLHDTIKDNIIISYGVMDTNKRTVLYINNKLKIRLDLLLRNYSEFYLF